MQHFDAIFHFAAQKFFCSLPLNDNDNVSKKFSDDDIFLENLVMCHIITHLAGQTYVWHDCKWNFAGPQS